MQKLQALQRRSIICDIPAAAPAFELAKSVQITSSDGIRFTAAEIESGIMQRRSSAADVTGGEMRAA